MVPSNKVTLKKFRLMLKPWITKDILRKCDERDSLLKEIKAEIDPVRKKILRTNFNALRNQVTKEKRQSKKAYFTALFEKNKNAVSNIWKCIRSLVNLKPSKKSSIKLMDEDQNMISDSKTIAKIFNDHFSALGAKVQQKIPTVEGKYDSYLKKRQSDGKLVINPDGSTFFLSPTKPNEISKIIDGLDSRKSTGPNGTPVFILKIFKDFLSIWLPKLINLCFETGEFPDLLKVAKVIPLHKKESIFNFLNYRPISLLSVFSKIYEKSIYRRWDH
jgi:Notch-like protein